MANPLEGMRTIDFVKGGELEAALHGLSIPAKRTREGALASTAKAAPPQGPLSTLSDADQLLVRIFSFVGPNVRAVSKLAAVCQRWRALSYREELDLELIARPSARNSEKLGLGRFPFAMRGRQITTLRVAPDSVNTHGNDLGQVAHELPRLASFDIRLFGTTMWYGMPCTLKIRNSAVRSLRLRRESPAARFHINLDLPALSSLRIDCCAEWTEAQLCSLVQGRKGLLRAHLKLPPAEGQADEERTGELQRAIVTQLGVSCPDLEDLSFGSDVFVPLEVYLFALKELSKLRFLRFEHCADNRNDAMQTLTEAAAKNGAERVELLSFPFKSQDLALVRAAKLFPNLRALKFPAHFSGDALSLAAPNLTGVRRVTVRMDSERLRELPSLLADLDAAFPTLTELLLDFKYHHKETGLRGAAAAAAFPPALAARIRYLSLRHAAIDDAGLAALLAALPVLDELDVRDCLSLSMECLPTLRARRLRRLRMEGLLQWGAEGAPEWLID
eukprot:tig00020564_g11435.t1